MLSLLDELRDQLWHVHGEQITTLRLAELEAQENDEKQSQLKLDNHIDFDPSSSTGWWPRGHHPCKTAQRQIPTLLHSAHLLRELIYAHEQHHQAWAEKLIICLLDAKNEADEAQTNGALILDAARISHYDRRYSRILRQGLDELPRVPIPSKKKRGRAKQHKVKNLHNLLFPTQWR